MRLKGKESEMVLDALDELVEGGRKEMQSVEQAEYYKLLRRKGVIDELNAMFGHKTVCWDEIIIACARKECNEVFVKGKGQQRKEYCSVECRKKNDNERSRKFNKVIKSCEYYLCDNQFEATVHQSKYCSVECRRKAQRQRTDAKEFEEKKQLTRAKDLLLQATDMTETELEEYLNDH